MLDIGSPTITSDTKVEDNSAEFIAWRLLQSIAAKEGFGSIEIMGPRGWIAGAKMPSREWVLDSYSQCIRAVRGER